MRGVNEQRRTISNLPITTFASCPPIRLYALKFFHRSWLAHSYHLRCKQATIMHAGLTKCVNGPITAAYVGCRTISGSLIVFITNSFKRYIVQEHIIPRSTLVVLTSCSVVFFSNVTFQIFSRKYSIINSVLVCFRISTVSFPFSSLIISTIWFINSTIELSVR